MTFRRIWLVPIGTIMISGLCAVAQDKAALPAETVPVAAAVAAPRPLNPAEMSPKPPKVVCHGDTLTISADNSTLASILAQVRGCTGAKIDIPEGMSGVRSFEELGPAPVSRVLDDLLSATAYNYVIQSSDTNPSKVEMVLLTARAKDGPATATTSAPAELAMTPARRAWTQMQRIVRPDRSEQGGDDAVDTPSSETVSASEPADTIAQAAPAPVDTPASGAAVADVAAPPAPAASQNDPSTSADPAKAVHDRINSMQQMFDQRRQMMQKQNGPGTQGSVPNSN